ncbi:MAG: hypothetical protein WDN04_19970 [Rhodospirillales bacterium]
MGAADDIDAEILLARARQVAAVEPFDVTRLPAAEGRARMNAAASPFNDGQPPMAHIEEYSVRGDDGNLRVRLYTPPGAGDGRDPLYSRRRLVRL